MKLLQTGATREREERFLREARLVAGLNHPNIISYVDMGQERDGTQYIVMEAVNGPDLQLVLDQRGFLQQRETVAIIKGVLSGLACTHAHNVVHRDLKPANILVVLKDTAPGAQDRRSSQRAPEGPIEVQTVKIIDFGLARELSSTSLLTGENVVGTPMYFAPEQTISGAEISTITDLWAVGVLIFHAITGTLPFAKLGDALQVIVHEICTKDPPDVCAASQGRASPALRKVVMAALQKHAHRRIQSADLMLKMVLGVETEQASHQLTEPADAAKGSAVNGDSQLRQMLKQTEEAMELQGKQLKAAQHQLRGVKQERQDLEQKNQQLQHDKEALEAKVRDLTRANDDFHYTIKEQHKEAARTKQDLSDLQEAQAKLSSLQQEVTQLQDEASQLRSANAALQVESEEATQVLRDKTEVLDKTQKHVNFVIQQSLSKDNELAQHVRQLKELQDEAFAHEQTRKQQEQQLRTYAKEIEVLTVASRGSGVDSNSEMAEALHQVRTLESQRAHLESKLQQAQEELARSRESAAAAQLREHQAVEERGSGADAAALEMELAAVRDKCAVLQQQIDTGQQTLQEASLKREMAEAEVARSKRDLHEAQQRGQGLRLQLADMEAKLGEQQKVVEEHKLVVENLEVAVDHVRRENETLLAERHEGSVAAARLLQMEHALSSAKTLEVLPSFCRVRSLTRAGVHAKRLFMVTTCQHVCADESEGSHRGAAGTATGGTS